MTLVGDLWLSLLWDRATAHLGLVDHFTHESQLINTVLWEFLGFHITNNMC